MHGILIADDNCVLTMVLESLLSSMGHKVVGIAHSGNEAIALAREHRRPDLVFMDIAMPGELDGIDASEMRSWTAYQHADNLNLKPTFLEA